MEKKKFAEGMLSLSDNIYKYKSRLFKNFKVNSKSNNELGARQFYILFTIGYFEIRTISEISCHASQSNSSMSLIISKLVRSGYLYKEYPDATQDNRKVYFYLTQQGTAMLEQQTLVLLQDIETFYYELSISQKTAFDLAIKHLSEMTPEYEKLQIIKTKKVRELSNKYPVALKTLKISVLCGTLHKICIIKEQDFENMKYALSMRQCFVLRCIESLNAHTIKDLKKIIFLSESTISTSVSKLVLGGFLYKEYPDIDSDLRKVYFYTTDKGSDALEHIDDCLIKLIMEYHDQLPALERDHLREAIISLNKMFAEF